MLEDNATPETTIEATTETAHETEKLVNVKITVASREKLNDAVKKYQDLELHQGSRQDFLEFALARLEKLEAQVAQLKPAVSDTGNSEDEEKELPWFTAISGTTKAERETKLSEIKELLGIPESEGIFMTRNALYHKAAELSGKTVSEVIEAGADSEAQSIITSKRTGAKGANRGRAGAGDEKLDRAFVAIVKEIVDGTYTPLKGLPLTAISMKVRTNPKTAENWAQRRGLVFKMDTETAIEEARKIEEELNQIAEHGR